MAHGWVETASHSKYGIKLSNADMTGNKCCINDTDHCPLLTSLAILWGLSIRHRAFANIQVIFGCGLARQVFQGGFAA